MGSTGNQRQHWIETQWNLLANTHDHSRIWFCHLLQQCKLTWIHGSTGNSTRVAAYILSGRYFLPKEPQPEYKFDLFIKRSNSQDQKVSKKLQSQKQFQFFTNFSRKFYTSHLFNFSQQLRSSSPICRGVPCGLGMRLFNLFPVQISYIHTKFHNPALALGAMESMVTVCAW